MQKLNHHINAFEEHTKQEWECEEKRKKANINGDDDEIEQCRLCVKNSKINANSTFANGQTASNDIQHTYTERKLGLKIKCVILSDHTFD